MSDKDILASLLQKFIDDGSYFCWGLHHDGQSGFLTLDGTVELSTDEVAALGRATGLDGQAWWEKSS